MEQQLFIFLLPVLYQSVVEAPINHFQVWQLFVYQNWIVLADMFRNYRSVLLRLNIVIAGVTQAVFTITSFVK